MPLPDALVDLLRRPSPCFVATLMPDGSPQMTQTWVDTDGTHVLINTVDGHQKVRNMRRDPRVAVNVADPEDPSRYFAVRGRVVGITEDGAREHIDELSHRYIGRPYPWFGGADQVRLLVTIAPERVTSPQG
jgi:PPOX class probable F420-dependent enzyme